VVSPSPAIVCDQTQSISGAGAINPLVAFYDIHGRKREVIFFNFVPDTTSDSEHIIIFSQTWYDNYINNS
jgi:hypothetical protein